MIFQIINLPVTCGVVFAESDMQLSKRLLLLVNGEDSASKLNIIQD